MKTMLDMYIPQTEINRYMEMDTILKNYTMEEVFVHYTINNDIDLYSGIYEPYIIWGEDIKAQMYYDMKVHEAREQYEHCLLLRHTIKNSDEIYQRVATRYKI